MKVYKVPGAVLKALGRAVGRRGLSLVSPSRAGAGSGAGGRSVGWHTAIAEAGLLPPAAGS